MNTCSKRSRLLAKFPFFLLVVFYISAAGSAQMNGEATRDLSLIHI